MKKTFFTTLVLLAGTSVLSAENIITTPIDSDLYPTEGHSGVQGQRSEICPGTERLRSRQSYAGAA